MSKETPRTDEKRREFRNVPTNQLVELLWDWAENFLEFETRDGMQMLNELLEDPNRWSYKYTDPDEILDKLNFKKCAPVNEPFLRNVIELAREVDMSEF